MRKNSQKHSARKARCLNGKRRRKANRKKKLASDDAAVRNELRYSDSKIRAQQLADRLELPEKNQRRLGLEPKVQPKKVIIIGRSSFGLFVDQLNRRSQFT